MRLGAVASSLLCVLCAAATAWSDERVETSRYELRFQREAGAESCASAAVLARLLDQVLDPASRPIAQVQLEGQAARAVEGSGFRIRLATRDAAGDLVGERELTTSGPDCWALTPALLLVLAMSVDPNAVPTEFPSAVRAQLEESPATTEAPAPAATPSALTRSASTLALPLAAADSTAAAQRLPIVRRTSVAGAVTLSHAILPHSAFGVALAVQVPLPHAWSLTASARGFPPQGAALPPSPYLVADEVKISALQLVSELCREHVVGTFQLSLCGGAHFGVRWVEATALAEKSNPARPFFGPTLGAKAYWYPSPSWFVGATGNVDATLLQDRFGYVDHWGHTQLFFEPSRFSQVVGLGAGAVL